MTVVELLRQVSHATANFGAFIALGLVQYQRREESITDSLDLVQLSWKIFDRKGDVFKVVVEIFNAPEEEVQHVGPVDLAQVCFPEDEHAAALSRWFFVFVLTTASIDLEREKAKSVLELWKAWCIHNDVPADQYVQRLEDLQVAADIAFRICEATPRSLFSHAESREASRSAYAAELVAKTALGVGFLAAAGSAAFTAFGFGPAGISAGSWAASIQTANTVAGGTFATLQGLGATGAILSVGVAGVGVAAAGAAVYMARRSSSTASSSSSTIPLNNGL